jgi:hypothetical protein
VRASISIAVTREGDTLTLRTTDARGPGQLEMVGVPEAAREPASVALRIVAELAAEITPEPNETVGVRLAHSLLAVRLVEARDRNGQPFLRVSPAGIDVREDEPPWSAIGSVLLDEAGDAVERGDLEAAERSLRASLALFEGDPARAALDGLGPEHNRENALAYRMLALDVGPPDAPALFAAWLRRDPYSAFLEIGGAANDLAEPSYVHLAELARFIAYQTLREADEARTRSPIWVLDDDGRVARSIRSWPLGYRALYYRGEPARALAEDWTIEAIVDAFARRRHDPLALFERTFATHALWREPPDAALEVTKKPFVMPSRILSLMLAHVGHGVAAGMDRGEVRASLGADDSKERRARAEKKIEAFRPTVRAWKDEVAG